MPANTVDYGCKLFAISDFDFTSLIQNRSLVKCTKRRLHNNNNNPICKAPECQKTSVALGGSYTLYRLLHDALSQSIAVFVVLTMYRSEERDY